MNVSIPPPATRTDPLLPEWRPMDAGDLKAVVALAGQLHPGCPERTDVLDERRRLCPEGCLILPDAQGKAGGYMLSHPWRMATPPALDTYLHHLPARPDCWYLHDIAILPALRGRGATHAALQIMTRLACARALRWLALVATEGAGPVWAHLGFTPTPGIPPAITATYGADACPMRRGLTST
ncbi:GNAT family N-acetyltransferase [Komagataeibacter medellinensis]|uniref:GNAT family N-acetyltransferase n=1 Tax=Komagataeibacter medellinensis TaxID=1177712 RepID=A0ABQ6VVF2_9PROT|nr:GNAT family N-acetyltransferase [Komagataeibacter medellinensis]KAB8124175.1 GNAT family N-acetyltransferase [Komagataeibacter medellinensis]